MSSSQLLLEPHIVDTLIEERAQWLLSQPWLWRSLRSFIYPMLGYATARELMDRLSPMSATQVFRYLVESLALAPQCEGLAQVPATGSVILVANHPTGIADGVAVYAALSAHRPDLAFFANRDAIRVAPGLKENIIPVEWRAHLRTRSDTRATSVALNRCLKEQRPILLFPSGRLSRPSIDGLRERPWQVSAIHLARKHRLPIVPLNIKARNSPLFYLFWFLAPPIKDMMLFRELMNKTAYPYRMRIGPSIDPSTLTGDLESDTRALQRYVENGCAGPFAPPPPRHQEHQNQQVMPGT